jgi:Flp pilus assembly protein TadD
MTFLRHLLAMTMGCAAMAIAAPAIAQQTDAERTALARTLFREGVALVDQQRWDEAVDHFRRAYALRPSPVVGFNLASALAEQGHPVEASELLRTALRDASADRAVRADAQALLAEVEPRVGRLTIRVEGSTDGVELHLDDRVLTPEAIGVAAPADPGRHVLQALRGGVVVVTEEATVPPGGSAEIAVHVPAAPPPPSEVALAPVDPDPGLPVRHRAPPDEPEPSGGLLASPWFWIAVAVVAAGSIATIVLLSPSDPSPVGADLGAIEVRGR